MTAAFLDGVVQQAGLFAVSALGIALSMRILNWPDLTVDGSFTLGGAIAATLIIQGGSPVLCVVAAMVGGALAGTATFLLNRCLGISKMLAGILIMMILYSVNLRIMGRANISLLGQDTLFTPLDGLENGSLLRICAYLGCAVLAFLLVAYVLVTRLGLYLRAVGDNEFMVQGLGVASSGPFLFGLAASNALVAASGALVAQNQGFADVGMGTGIILIGLAALIVGEVALSGIPVLARMILRAKPASMLKGRMAFLPWQPIGEMAAAVLGAFLYFAILAGSLELGLEPTDLKLATGIAVIAGIALKLKGPSVDTYARSRF